MKIANTWFTVFDPEKHKDVRRFDNTKLTAHNTCPTWGIIRYEQHKVFTTGYRSMALEAGSACHIVFAAIRFMSLIGPHSWYLDDVDALNAINAHARENLGDEMWDMCLEFNTKHFSDDWELGLLNCALEAFSMTGYYEDPNDKRRTVANIEECLIAYVQRYPFKETQPVVKKLANGEWFVGVEIPFNVILNIELDDGNIYQYRFTGRGDGIHWKNSDMETIVVEDNKTASRINDAWQEAFRMAHQFTGYVLATQFMLQHPVEEALARGMTIPLPRNYDYGGIVNVPLLRDSDKFANWARWVHHTMELTKPYLDNPLDAPRYTHSCNRYMSTCSLMPLCDSSREEQEEIIEEMVQDEWDVLEENVNG